MDKGWDTKGHRSISGADGEVGRRWAGLLSSVEEQRATMTAGLKAAELGHEESLRKQLVDEGNASIAEPSARSCDITMIRKAELWGTGLPAHITSNSMFVCLTHRDLLETPLH